MYSDRKNLVFVMIFIGVLFFVFKAVQLSFGLTSEDSQAVQIIEECTDENLEGC